MGMLLVSSGSLFCAQHLSAEHEQKKRVEAIKKMHAAQTREQLEQVLVQGLPIDTPLANSRGWKMFSLGSIILNPKASPDLVDVIMDACHKRGINNPDLMLPGASSIGLSYIIPALFGYVMFDLHRDEKLHGSEEQLIFIEKHKRLVQNGVPLDSRFKIIEQAGGITKISRGQTFADWALFSFSMRDDEAKEQAKIALALCKVIHTEGEKRQEKYQELRLSLADGLPRFSLDLCGVVGSYVAKENTAEDQAELKKMKDLLDHSDAQELLKEFESDLKKDGEKSKEVIELPLIDSHISPF